MASFIEIKITLSGGHTFTNGFSAFLNIAGYPGSPIHVDFTTVSTTVTEADIPLNLQLSSGVHNFSITNITDITPITTGTVGTVNFTFNDTPSTSVNAPLISLGGGDYTVNATITINCLHGDSIITTINGNKFIKDAKEGDKVLTANGEYAEIINVSHCWIKHPGPSHDAVIFEPYSLTDQLPISRLIIDPGHPIKINIDDEFKAAGEFVTGDKIYVCKWTDEIIQNPTPSRRWDLVLEDGFDNYIANGVIIKSRTTVSEAGYKHSYKNLI